jgi:dihydroneopterin aldolase/2-amino-4-hydroxy-6-hydroxymethyldihydropteridine diphosphokinase/dihydropteroate synthase
MGSNLGDRFHNIESALRLLETPQDVFQQAENRDPSSNSYFATVVDTSFLYESSPMYVTDQPSFINCACIVSAVFYAQ